MAILATLSTASCIAAIVVIAIVLIPLIARSATFGMRDRILIFAASILIGASIGLSGSSSYVLREEGIDRSEQMHTFELAEDARTGLSGTSATARIIGGDADGSKVTLNLPSGEMRLTGEVLKGRSSIAWVSEASAERSYEAGIIGRVTLEGYETVERTVPASWLLSARKEAIAALASYGGEHAALLQALICGYRPPLSEEGTYDSFKASGTAHMVAVSGAHLAIVLAAFTWMLGAMRIGRRMRIAVSIGFVMCYLVFTGMPVSAMRAAAMAILASLAGIVRRRGAASNAVAICVIAFIALDPVASVSLSLFLSAGSTIGILLFSGLAMSWFGAGARSKTSLEGIGKGVAEPLSLTLASNVVTLPYSAAEFSMVSLVSPFANVLATPMLTLACVVGMLAVSIASSISPFAPVVIGIASAAAAPLGISMAVIGSLPFATLHVEADTVCMLLASAALAAILWVTWPRSPIVPISVSAVVASLLLGSAIYAYLAPHGDEIVMLDVGQGDAILVRSGSSKVLIDTGNQDDRLLEGLRSEGVHELDALVLTHPDDDHIGSMDAVFGTMEVKSVMVASDALRCGCSKCETMLEDAEKAIGEERIIPMGVGDTIALGNIRLETVWPHRFTDEGGNRDSLCLLLSFDPDGDGEPEASALFTGDAESEQLREMLSEGEVGHVDILKVGHHGSKTSLDDGTVQALDPSIALISVGEDNRYGHPTRETLEKLDEVGATVLRTDDGGKVRLLLSRDGIRVE